MRLLSTLLSSVLAASLIGSPMGCSDEETPPHLPAAAAAQETVPKSNLVASVGPTLLLSQAQFVYEVLPNGKKSPRPGAAKLTSLTLDSTGFRTATLEDADSRVFHKAICLNDEKSPREILTLGANGAHLKTWQHTANGWVGSSHWKPTFGGKWDRLRDVERGDVDHDGKDELVLATHDQGVIAVASFQEGKWSAKEIHREPNTFIHEIEIGDVDGDGKLEFFATPSQPNSATQSQGGSVVAFFHQPDGSYQKQVVTTFPKRHAKEILLADIDGDGKDELYASIEAQTRRSVSGPTVVHPLEIRRYDLTKKGVWQPKAVATLAGGIQARVLLAGDLMNTGHEQVVVTTMKGGVFALEWRPDQGFKTHLIDADSSGFEHAAGLFDVDHDGKLELYVAADDQDVVRQYQYENGKFTGKVVAQLAPRDLTWSIEFCP